jgi:hypothetical protein
MQTGCPTRAEYRAPLRLLTLEAASEAFINLMVNDAEGRTIYAALARSFPVGKRTFTEWFATLSGVTPAMVERAAGVILNRTSGGGAIGFDFSGGAGTPATHGIGIRTGATLSVTFNRFGYVPYDISTTGYQF